METIDIKEKFIELRAKGYSFDKIAKELNKAKQTLIDWSKDLEEEIANLKSLELESLYEKHYLLKENRIELFAGLIDRIKKEALSRDLSDVPTDKLFDLLLKYSNQLKEESIDLVFKSSEEIAEDKIDKDLFSITSTGLELKQV